jgi:hypothetical protein
MKVPLPGLDAHDQVGLGTGDSAGHSHTYW